MLAGKAPAILVLLVTGVLAPVTILSCYAFAVYYGHVEPWPHTDISHCAVHAPEKFIFRIGMIPTCCGIALIWYFTSRWVSALRAKVFGVTQTRWDMFSVGNVTAIMGAVGAALLIVASAVLESDASALWGLHSFCASTFFALSIIAQSAVTIELYLLSSALSKQQQEGQTKWGWKYKYLWIKALINIVSFTMLLLDAFVFHQRTVIDNIFEWSMVSLIITYHGTYIYDWWNVFYEEAYIISG